MIRADVKADDHISANVSPMIMARMSMMLSLSVTQRGDSSSNHTGMQVRWYVLIQ